MSAPALSRPTANGRAYVHPITGDQVPSVTTIISGGLPKPVLVPWAAKMAAEYAVKQWDALAVLGADERIELIKGAHRRNSDKAANLGSAVHEAIDAFCRAEMRPEWLPGVEEHMEQFWAFLLDRDPTFLHNEATIWNYTEGYAGTLDFIADINGRMTLGDVKTGKSIYPEIALQLTALARGEVIIFADGTEIPMPPVDILCGLHIRPQSWALVPVVPTGASWDAFLAAKTITEWTRDTAPNVLGARLRGIK